MLWHMKYPLHKLLTLQPLSSRDLADSPASLEHQFNMFKANMEFDVAALLAKVEEQSYIIDKNNQELCKLTKDNLH